MPSARHPVVLKFQTQDRATPEVAGQNDRRSDISGEGHQRRMCQEKNCASHLFFLAKRAVVWCYLGNMPGTAKRFWDCHFLQTAPAPAVMESSLLAHASHERLDPGAFCANNPLTFGACLDIVRISMFHEGLRRVHHVAAR